MANQLQYHLDMQQQSQWKIASANALAKQNLLYMQEAGMFYSGSAYYTTREKLDSFLIKLTVSGQGILSYGEESYCLQPGDFFWIDCKEYQDYRTADGTDHWHVLWVHFSGVATDNYYALFRQLNHGSPIGHLQDMGKARKLMQQLLKLCEVSNGELDVDIQSANLLTQLLTMLLEAVAHPSAPQIPPMIAAVRDYLTENYNRPVSLEMLSRQFHISKFYLLRTFSHYLGLTPNEYQQNLRIAKAKELLRTTRLTVSMIANAVGIESTSYFISIFKRLEGVTPLKYRSTWESGAPLR